MQPNSSSQEDTTNGKTGDTMTDAKTAQVLRESAAKTKMLENVRDWLTVKVTIPLGDTKFKEIHTNTFIWLPLLDEMDLANYEDVIYYVQGLISHSRWQNSTGGYIRDRWYVEACNITNDAGGKFQMELTLNPLPTTLNEYSSNVHKWETDYTEALSKGESGSNITSTSSSSKSVASTSGNSTLKGGQGDTIDNLVKKIVGNETDELKKAKLIHDWLKSNVNYKRYCCCKYANAPEKAYNNRRSLNCGDTAILTCSMMKSAGLNAYIVHRTYNGGHFWTIIEINGKKYASDQTGDGSNWNTVWSYSGRGNTSITDYSHKESGLSCGCGYYSC